MVMVKGKERRAVLLHEQINTADEASSEHGRLAPAREL